MNTDARLKTILAYEFSGQRSYDACDIPTRARITKLISKLQRVMLDQQLPLLYTLARVDATFGEAVDNDEPISGADAVEFIVDCLPDVRAALFNFGGAK